MRPATVTDVIRLGITLTFCILGLWLFSWIDCRKPRPSELVRSDPSEIVDRRLELRPANCRTGS